MSATKTKRAQPISERVLDCRHCNQPLYRVTSTWGTDSGWRHQNGSNICRLDWMRAFDSGAVAVTQKGKTQ